MDIAGFKELPVMGILRAPKPEAIAPLVETIVSSGLKTIEITMDSEGAADLIRQIRCASKGRLIIGAGTVLNMELLKRALDAGAAFIVMPTLVRDVVEYCAKKAIAVFPGALTPQEIYNAWNAGAAMVKVFPAGLFGPGYIREIKAPFRDIELMACGGVTSENIKAYFTSGASAVAFGAGIFRPEWLLKKEFARIGETIKNLLKGMR